MLKRLYRQRRRILFLMAMVALGGLLYTIDNPQLRYMLKHEFQGPAWILPLSVALAFLIFTLGASVVVLLIFPAARRALEVGGVSFVVLEAVRFVPVSLPDWAINGANAPFAFFCLYLGLNFALEKDLLFRRGLRLPYRARASRIIAASPEAIWAAMAPDAETMGTYWTRTLLKVGPREDVGPDVFEVRYRLGPHGTLSQRQTRRIWNKPVHFQYDFAPEDTEGTRSMIRGTFEMRCELPGDGRTRVELRHAYPALGFGTVSLLWLDDLAASELDAIAARIAGRRDWSIAGWSARKMAQV